MQKTIFAIIFFLFFSINFVNVSNAQEIRTNAQGQEIMVYPDGTWKLLDDVEDELSPDTNATAVEESKDKKQARLDAIKRADEAFRLANRAEEEYQAAKLNRIIIEEELEDLDELKDQDEWTRVHNLYLAAKAKQKSAKKTYKEAKEYADLMDKMIYMSDKRRQKLLAKLEQEDQRQDQEDTEKTTVSTNITATEDDNTPNPSTDFMEFEEEKEDVKPVVERKAKDYKKYDISKDVFFTPPHPDCQYGFQGVDEFSKKQRVDVADQLFFSYTSDQMRQFMKDREYITCYGHVTKISGGLRFLTLKFHIASNLAPQSFGNLPKGSILSIQLLDGETVRLRNTKDDPGYFDQHENAYIYRGIYPMGGKQIKMLKNGEIDKVRVVWGTGYEDYDIYEMDFLKNQLGCLE